jgi:hypothetical protein
LVPRLIRNTRLKSIIIALVLTIAASDAVAQKADSAAVKADSLINTVFADTVTSKADKRQFSPRKAAIRSAIIPGWGQAYNRKYWKIPIVYGALGTTAVVFRFNLTEYKNISFAYRYLVNPNRDSADLKKIGADLQPFIRANASNDLRNYRNSFRKNIDYSVLVFLLFWGLNVVDATVDAHLKGFDVSDDLSLKFQPGFSPMSNTTGLSLVLDIHKGRLGSRWLK